MSDDHILHLSNRHAEEHSKYVYFLLAATGAALGYGLQKLDSSTYNSEVWLGLGAIALWLASFFCGCKHVTTIQSVIMSNFHLVQLQAGTHPAQPRSEVELRIAWEVTNRSIETKNNRAQLFFQLQFWLLSFGALLFAAWRVVALVAGAKGAP
jgi:hypothetical protein